jgi:uncharacterized membrane protein YbhN (UPF0104 family)
LPRLVEAFTCPENPRLADLNTGLFQNEATDVKTAIKALVTAALLWLLFRSVEVSAVWAMLAGVTPAGVVVALALVGLIILADALLFVGSMRILGRQVPLSVSLLYTLVGWFFSNVAPSTVGGDLFRGVQMSRLGTPVHVAVRALVIMRVATLAALLVVMLAGLPVAWRLVGNPTDLVPFEVVLLAAGAAVAMLFLLAHLPIPERLQQRWPLLGKATAAAADFRKLLAVSGLAAKIWTRPPCSTCCACSSSPRWRQRSGSMCPSPRCSPSCPRRCWWPWYRSRSAAGACGRRRWFPSSTPRG